MVRTIFTFRTTLTAFAKLSYGKRDFAKAEGRKTENGEGDTRRRRGSGRVKKYNPTKNGVITRQKILKSQDRVNSVT